MFAVLPFSVCVCECVRHNKFGESRNGCVINQSSVLQMSTIQMVNALTVFVFMCMHQCVIVYYAIAYYISYNSYFVPYTTNMRVDVDF